MDTVSNLRPDNDFEQLLRDIAAEARDEGPEAVAELKTFDEYFANVSQSFSAATQSDVRAKL